MNSGIDNQRMEFYLAAGMSAEQARDRYLFVDKGLPVPFIAESLGGTPGQIRSRIREANEILDHEANRNTPKLPPYAYPLPHTGDEYVEIEERLLRRFDDCAAYDRFIKMFRDRFL